MITVEERHGLIQMFEAAMTAAKAHHCVSHNGEALDRVLRGAVEREIAQREFYEFLNLITQWHPHPAARSAAAAGGAAGS